MEKRKEIKEIIQALSSRYYFRQGLDELHVEKAEYIGKRFCVFVLWPSKTDVCLVLHCHTVDDPAGSHESTVHVIRCGFGRFSFAWNCNKT